MPDAVCKTNDDPTENEWNCDKLHCLFPTKWSCKEPSWKASNGNREHIYRTCAYFEYKINELKNFNLLNIPIHDISSAFNFRDSLLLVSDKFGISMVTYPYKLPSVTIRIFLIKTAITCGSSARNGVFWLDMDVAGSLWWEVSLILLKIHKVKNNEKMLK